MNLSKINTPSSRKIGADGEKIACIYLEKNSWEIVDTNWHKRVGELDIIAHKFGKVHFIEVKMRQSKNHNAAAENLTPTKKKRFLKIGLLWASFHGLQETQYQFDFIAIEKIVTGWRVSHYLNIEL